MVNSFRILEEAISCFRSREPLSIPVQIGSFLGRLTVHIWTYAHEDGSPAMTASMRLSLWKSRYPSEYRQTLPPTSTDSSITESSEIHDDPAIEATSEPYAWIQDEVG